LHAFVVGGNSCELFAEAERAGDVDGVERSYVYRRHLSRGGYDTCAEQDDRG
jgi:hypothetical protein